MLPLLNYLREQSGLDFSVSVVVGKWHDGGCFRRASYFLGI